MHSLRNFCAWLYAVRQRNEFLRWYCLERKGERRLHKWLTYQSWGTEPESPGWIAREFVKWRLVSRAVASLSPPVGQDKNISSIFPHFTVFLSFSSNFFHFLPHFVLRVGGSHTREGPGYATVGQYKSPGMILLYYKCTRRDRQFLDGRKQQDT